jgi:hypothetical protein
VQPSRVSTKPVVFVLTNLFVSESRQNCFGHCKYFRTAISDEISWALGAEPQEGKLTQAQLTQWLESGIKAERDRALFGLADKSALSPSGEALGAVSNA